MEKQKIGVLFSRAWKRSCDWKLNVFMLLLSLIFYAPAGAVIWWRECCFRKDGAWTEPAEIAFWIVTAAVFSWLYGMLGLAGMREIVSRETSLRRGFGSILPGWAAALVLEPWILLIVLPWCAAMHWQPEMLEYKVLGNIFGAAIIPLTLFSLCMFLLLAAGLAAASTGLGELYRQAFRAFRRGWGRWLIALLVLYPAGVAASLVLVPLGFAIDHIDSIWLGMAAFILQTIVFNWFMIFFGSVSAALYAEAAMPDLIGGDADARLATKKM